MYRPTSITVIAIFGLIIGGLGALCCSPLQLIGAFGLLLGLEPEPVFGMTVSYSTTDVILQSISSLMNIVASFGLLAGSFGCFTMKPWAPKVMKASSWLILLSNVPYFFSMIGPSSQSMMQNPSGPPISEGAAIVMAIIVSAIITLILSIYPVIVLIVFAMSSTKQAFEYAANPNVYTQWQQPYPPQYGYPQQQYPPYQDYPQQQGGYPPPPPYPSQEQQYPPQAPPPPEQQQGPGWYQPPPDDQNR